MLAVSSLSLIVHLPPSSETRIRSPFILIPLGRGQIERLGIRKLRLSRVPKDGACDRVL